MEEINLEEGMPIVLDAMNKLKEAIKKFKQRKVKVLVVIHGYGSSGKGGAICKHARQWLKAQVNNGYIKSMIEGENFDMFNAVAREIKNTYANSNKYYGKGNNGITVVQI